MPKALVTKEGVLVAYAEWLDSHHGVPPTKREFSAVLGFAAPTGAWWWLEAIEAEGWVFHGVPERQQERTRRVNDLVLTEKGRALAEALMLRAVKRDLEAVSA